MILEKLASIRSGLMRMSSYMGMINFLILMGIVLRWVHGSIAPDANFLLWMISGFIFTATGLVIAAWIDRKWIWPREVGINQKVNKITVVWALQAAELMHYMGDRDLVLEKSVEDAMERSGVIVEYRRARLALQKPS